MTASNPKKGPKSVPFLSKPLAEKVTEDEIVERLAKVLIETAKHPCSDSDNYWTQLAKAALRFTLGKPAPVQDVEGIEELKVKLAKSESERRYADEQRDEWKTHALDGSHANDVLSGNLAVAMEAIKNIQMMSAALEDRPFRQAAARALDEAMREIQAGEETEAGNPAATVPGMTGKPVEHPSSAAHDAGRTRATASPALSDEIVKARKETERSAKDPLTTCYVKWASVVDERIATDAALAEKDKRIAELESAVAKYRNALNSGGNIIEVNHV